MPIPTRLPADVELCDALPALHDTGGTRSSLHDARANGLWPQVRSNIEKQYTDNLLFTTKDYRHTTRGPATTSCERKDC